MDIEVSKVRRRLAGHPVYQSLSSVEDLRFFMERHVVAVWDFMSLLKSLQSELTTVTWPWHPPRDPNAARLVNEIVLGEESDEIADGVFRSHFEWYLDAMDEVGADRGPIDRFVAALTAGQPWKDALASSRLPGEAQTFVKSTMKLAGGPLHVRASAFFYGREDLIPDMFIKLVAHLRKEGHPCETLNAYLERHIEVDGGEHGPMARRLLETLTGDNSKRRAEVEKAAITALRARDRLWSAIDEGLDRDTMDVPRPQLATPDMPPALTSSSDPGTVKALPTA